MVNFDFETRLVQYSSAVPVLFLPKGMFPHNSTFFQSAKTLGHIQRHGLTLWKRNRHKQNRESPLFEISLHFPPFSLNLSDRTKAANRFQISGPFSNKLQTVSGSSIKSFLSIFLKKAP